MNIVIFVDWENLRYEIDKINSKPNIFSNFSTQNAYHVMALLHCFLLKDERLKKILFYTAKPLEMDKDSDKFKIEKYTQSLKFLDEMAMLPYVATRLGVSKFRGYDNDGKAIIIQKQVDMLIGLDIAHIVYNKLADRILIFSKDMDLVPALKCARINGITTIVANIKEGFELSPALIKHSDLVRNRNCEQILEYMKNVL